MDTSTSIVRGVSHPFVSQMILNQYLQHWHGLFQKGSSWADGPVGVTQCPILPGNSFLYAFDVPDQAGTFWYHSHLCMTPSSPMTEHPTLMQPFWKATQYCDGLRGPLVVYDPEDPYQDMWVCRSKETSTLLMAVFLCVGMILTMVWYSAHSSIKFCLIRTVIHRVDCHYSCRLVGIYSLFISVIAPYW